MSLICWTTLFTDEISGFSRLRSGRLVIVYYLQMGRQISEATCGFLYVILFKWAASVSLLMGTRGASRSWENHDLCFFMCFTMLYNKAIKLERYWFIKGNRDKSGPWVLLPLVDLSWLFVTLTWYCCSLRMLQSLWCVKYYRTVVSKCTAALTVQVCTHVRTLSLVHRHH